MGSHMSRNHISTALKIKINEVIVDVEFTAA